MPDVCQDPVSCYFYFILLPLVVNIMLYPSILCVALLMYLFVLWVACLTVFGCGCYFVVECYNVV